MTSSNPAPGFQKHPNYEVTLQPISDTMTVEVNGTEVARSTRAVQLLETKHRAVWYMPLDAVDQTVIEQTDTQTYCPFKGYASYWRINAGGQTVDDAIWAYMDPYDECLPVKGYASFYTNKVDLKINGELMNKDGPGWVA